MNGCDAHGVLACKACAIEALRADLDTAERQRHEEAADCDRWRARAKAAEKRAEWWEAEHSKRRGETLAALMVEKAAQDRSQDAEALLRECREVVETASRMLGAWPVMDGTARAHQAEERCWALLAKLAAREATKPGGGTWD